MKYLLLFISLTFLISIESMAQPNLVNLFDVYWGEELLDSDEYDIILKSEGTTLWPIFVYGGYHFVSPNSARKVDIVIEYNGQSISLSNVDIYYVNFYSHISISINPMAGDSCINIYSITGKLINQKGDNAACIAFHTINLVARQSSTYGSCNVKPIRIYQGGGEYLKGGLPAEFE